MAERLTWWQTLSRTCDALTAILYLLGLAPSPTTLHTLCFFATCAYLHMVVQARICACDTFSYLHTFRPVFLQQPRTYHYHWLT